MADKIPDGLAERQRRVQATTLKEILGPRLSQRATPGLKRRPPPPRDLPLLVLVCPCLRLWPDTADSASLFPSAAAPSTM